MLLCRDISTSLRSKEADGDSLIAAHVSWNDCQLAHLLKINLKITVSNLPFASKIIEKAVLSQVNPYMEANDLHTPCQSAYRPAHSTETALLHVQNDLLLHLDERKDVILVLLDLSAAFDTIGQQDQNHWSTPQLVYFIPTRSPPSHLYKWSSIRCGPITLWCPIEICVWYI